MDCKRTVERGENAGGLEQEKERQPQYWRKGLSQAETVAIQLFLAKKRREALPEAVREGWDNPESVDVQILQLVEFENGTIEMGDSIAISLSGVWGLRISPDGAVASYAEWEGNDEPITLYVVSIDSSSSPKLVSGNAAMYPDWTPDSRHLVYAALEGEPVDSSDDMLFGAVTKSRVIGEDCKFLANPTRVGELASIIMSGITKVRCLRNGRILFVSYEVTMPMTAVDIPAHPLIFSLDPDCGTTYTALSDSRL